MGSRYTPEEARQLVERFLSRKTIDPVDLIKVPYALAFLAVSHLETIACAAVDIQRLRWDSPSPALPKLVLYACGECGTLTQGPEGAPHTLACADTTCHGVAHPLPGAKNTTQGG